MPAAGKNSVELLPRRLGPSTEVEGLLNNAIAVLNGKKDRDSRIAAGEGALACRAYFRLAHFADQMYRHADAQMRSPEWAMRRSVIKHKQEQASCSQVHSHTHHQS